MAERHDSRSPMQPHYRPSPTSSGLFGINRTPAGAPINILPPLTASQVPLPSSKPYYDPILDPANRHTGYPGRYVPISPVQAHQQPDFPPRENGIYERSLASPTASQFPQPTTMRPPSSHARPQSYDPIRDEQSPAPRADPMSFSAILSTDPQPPSKPAYSPPISQAQRPSSRASTTEDFTMNEEVPASAPEVFPINNAISRSSSRRSSGDKHRANGDVAHSRSNSATALAKKRQGSDKDNVKDIEAAYARLNSADLSEPDDTGFEAAKERYTSQSRKRQAAVDEAEGQKRKRRQIYSILKMHGPLKYQASLAREHYFLTNQAEAWHEVQQKEINEEKERKKDMQRKRRREKTMQNEIDRRKEAMEKMQEAAQAGNSLEQEKYLKEFQKAEKKVRVTQTLLQGGTPSKEIREVTPLAPNLEGGITSTFPVSEDNESQVPNKKGNPRRGNRPRKSKEQKQAEKDAAAAAHAALERGEELPIPIAPKEEPKPKEKEVVKREPSQVKEPTPVVEFIPYVSKGYNQLYEQIWRDIARKDIPRVCRIKDMSLSTKQSNLRKTAQLASKEARRWQLRTNKSVKEVQARAKRSMREMLSFWRRNEREERDQRKLAEKQELEMARKAEADREANRQKRKLNFLISQTELYSHFIGKKVKTDAIERSTDDVAAVDETIGGAKPNAHLVDIPDTLSGKTPAKVTNFEDLDFDAEDDSELRAAAMANAQNAIKEAQDRARAFNNEDGQPGNSDFDEGEMNFQNPSSLQSMDVAQPRMLSCQLKEYQLKGLNWLVNLYEQGINGILADEMGLGKTVQSISVMAYLAETHNIWGPFLVIAPASTLHNWEQEIKKFVPDMKILPYWGTANDRKVLRKFWDRKHIIYSKEAQFHVMVTSYQLVVQDAQYFQKMRWQYMILDEAQAIKSSQSSRWKSLLGFHCRNRLLLTGTPIQNNMQELWALLHFIMPSLFDSHDEFSDWFSKDIESHAQSNTKLNEDQLRRLHMILKPFMLRRIKKHVQKELGDKVEKDVFCDLTYRQRAYYTNLRNKISIMDLIEKASAGDDQDTATLMNLVMQFRKVCNHPDLFERADTTSPLSFAYFAETASFSREGHFVQVAYSVRNRIEYRLPRLIARQGGRLELPGPDNVAAGWRNQWLHHKLNIWTPENITKSSRNAAAFSWMRFSDVSAAELADLPRQGVFERAIEMKRKNRDLGRFKVLYDEEDAHYAPVHSMLNIIEHDNRRPLADVTSEGRLRNLLNVSRATFEETGLSVIEPGSCPAVSAPPIDLYCNDQGAVWETRDALFNSSARKALYGISEKMEELILEAKIEPKDFPVINMLPEPVSARRRWTHIEVPSMRRFITDCGKLAKLDALLRELKDNGHRVLLYFQMTRMIDLMEEYLTYRNYKYCRLDGSTKLEDRRDTVADFQSKPDIFVFLLSTRAGGLGINLTSADTVIFYDSDWNPTIDSQAMDRAHRLGQTKQVTVYRMITRGTIEERIRKRALQKEEVQRVVISGGAGAQVDFNTRSRDNRTKDLAMWLADDDQAEMIEKKEAEIAAAEEKDPKGKKRKAAVKKQVNMEDMYHEGEGHFDDGNSNRPSGAATPLEVPEGPPGKKRKGTSKKAKTLKQRLAVADGMDDFGNG